MEKNIYVQYLEGGKISIGDMKKLLVASYKKKPENVQNYQLDDSLSDPRVQVYKRDGTNDVVVVHRGTQGLGDVLTDIKMFFGFKDGSRFKHAKKIQELAQQKYGKENVTTTGHSLGAKIAEDVGKDSKEIITLNKPTLPLDIIKKKNCKPKKQVDIKTTLDPVSILKPLETNNNTENITIPSKTLNPLDEHSVETLGRLDENMMVGAGQLKKMKKKQLKQYIKQKNKKMLVTGLNKKQLIEMASKLSNV